MVDVLVEFDYDAEQEDELTIKVGDVIRNVQMSEGGWWEGELNGKKGMFPDNFVKVIEKKKEEPKKELLVTQQRSSVRELANKLKDVHVGAAPQKRKEHHHHHHSEKRKKAKVLFDYEPENEDELKIEVGDTVEIIKQEEEGWWEGVLNGKTGVFPSNFVEIIGTEDEEPNNDLSESQPAEEKPETKGKKVMGIGLGNIFEGGPIKLRSTAASAKRPVEKQDPKPIVTEEPVVLKREKPVPQLTEE
uniref:CD2-associated protein n=1 Tax=Magallana gigas TaxID=29159 RepID=K1QWQ4_MAGGI